MSLAKNIIKSVVNKVISHEQSLFYRRHNHCSLCTKELAVETHINPSNDKLFEKVHCPNCKVTISTNEHSLN